MSDLAERMAALKAKMTQKAPIVEPIVVAAYGLNVASQDPRDAEAELTHEPGEANDEKQAALIEEAKNEAVKLVLPGPVEATAAPREMSDDDREATMRLSGLNVDMELEEYKDKFNAALTRDRLSEMANLLLVKGPFKPVVEMTLEEIQDHIQAISTFITEFRVIKQRSIIHFNEKVKDASDNEREALRKRDRAYKPRPSVAKDPAAPKKERATPKTKEEKAIESLMKAMPKLTYEKAKRMIEEGM
jgi:hypothetical protein